MNLPPPSISAVPPESDGPSWAVRISRGAGAGIASAPGAWYEGSKRLGDIIGAFIGLLVAAPFLLIIALWVRRDSRGPILHRRQVLARQPWPSCGQSGLGVFDAYKFRTMIENADAILQSDPALRREYEKEYKLSRDPRVTRAGEILRAYSMDELPQFFNVLKGEMSLVGPRILSPPEILRYGDRGGTLLSVRPGLTGLWQVSGRHSVPYEERVRLDLWYITHRSFLLDLAILWRTVGCVISRSGA
ncbi:MAG: sugar transferase [Cytophagales bacterium]|nr:sugar transferase [Armatimonadota bacterium]